MAVKEMIDHGREIHVLVGACVRRAVREALMRKRACSLLFRAEQRLAPTLDTLRNSFRVPRAEIFVVFKTMRAVGL
jgi:hypothetical protein